MSITDVLETVLVECGIDNVSPSVNGASFEMRQFKALMNEAGRDINTRAEWSRALKTFSVAAGATSQALPADFQEMPEGGSIEVNGHGLARPVADPSLWDFLSSEDADADAPGLTLGSAVVGGGSDQQTGASTGRYAIYYRMQGGAVHFTPALPVAVSVQYVSKNWLSGNKSGIMTDEDEPIFPERLLARSTIWRWRRQKGLPFDDHLAEFEADLEAALKADRGLA